MGAIFYHHLMKAIITTTNKSLTQLCNNNQQKVTQPPDLGIINKLKPVIFTAKIQINRQNSNNARKNNRHPEKLRH